MYCLANGLCKLNSEYTIVIGLEPMCELKLFEPAKTMRLPLSKLISILAVFFDAIKQSGMYEINGFPS